MGESATGFPPQVAALGPPYNESYHTPVTYGFGTELLLGSPYEYDVPATAVPTPAGCSFDTVTHTWVHTVTGNTMGQHHFFGPELPLPRAYVYVHGRVRLRQVRAARSVQH